MTFFKHIPYHAVQVFRVIFDTLDKMLVYISIHIMVFEDLGLMVTFVYHCYL